MPHYSTHWCHTSPAVLARGTRNRSERAKWDSTPPALPVSMRSLPRQVRCVRCWAKVRSISLIYTRPRQSRNGSLDSLGATSCTIRPFCFTTRKYVHAKVVNYLNFFLEKKADNRIAFIGHHLFSLFGVALGLKNNYGMWFIAFRLLTEISNPFMNMRGLIEMMGIKKNAPISRFNGKLFVASFVLTRPPMLPLFWGGSLYHLVKNSAQLFTFDWPRYL